MDMLFYTIKRNVTKAIKEYLIFIGQMLNLIWSFLSKSLVWLWGEQLQTTYIDFFLDYLNI